MTKLADLYSIISTLKQTKRQGWVIRNLNSDTIASHVYGATSLGFLIGAEEGVDKGRIIQMLIVHDWVMAKMEDLTPKGGKYDTKGSLEEEAKIVIKNMLPESIQEVYLELFNEYRALTTLESKVARECDKLDTLLQGEQFEIDGGRADILDEFLVTYKEIFVTEIGKVIYSEIVKRHEERKVLLLSNH